MTTNIITIQDFVSREIIYCVSSLIYILNKEGKLDRRILESTRIYIVSVGSNSKQYKVVGKVELDGVPHIEVIATYNSEMPALVGKTSYLKEAYRVLADDIHIDPKFHQQQEEITEKPERSEEDDFPSYPYTEIALDRIEFGDIITSNPYSRSAYIVKEHKGEFVLAECLYHKSLPGRVGEEFSFTTPYLVEKATSVAA